MTVAIIYLNDMCAESLIDRVTTHSYNTLKSKLYIVTTVFN